MPTSCVSRRHPFGNRGRSGRSIMRAISVAFSPARPSRLKKEPGILPAAYIRSSTSTVSGRKSTSRRLPAVAVESTRVSPAETTTEPDACLASLPVSKEISVPPTSTDTRVASGICSFLRPLLVSRPSASFDASVIVASILAGVGTPAAMNSRIVVFGSTGYTGRLVAERLAAQGARPVLAGRDERRLGELAERLGGLEAVRADATRRNSVFAAVGPGDVLVSTVGPFAKWGDAAVRAAIAAPGAVYLDSTGEPVFIRRVFEELGGPAGRSSVTLMPAMGFDYVPGALAGALALRDAGPRAVRVDVGYFSLGIGADGASAGTRESLVGATLNDNHAFREGAVRTVRPAERVRSFPVKGSERTAISVGGAEHYTLPPVHPT